MTIPYKTDEANKGLNKLNLVMGFEPISFFNFK